MLETYLIYFTIFLSFLTIMFFIRSTNILVITILNSVFSLFTVVMYLLLDAPDVAMTEAAVGILVSIFSVYTIRALNYSSSYEFTDSFKPFLFLLSIGFASLLMYASTDLPEFGSEYAISQQRTANYYLTNTVNDINIPSIVAAILASYRGYDTLLETLVILIGGLSVLLVSENSAPKREESDILISKLSRFIYPLILIFALYLQVHGEISPGGGFQAGAIIAIAFILYAMAFGDENLLKHISLHALKNIAIIGQMIYLGTGILGLINGSEFLNYNIFSSDKFLAQKIGIITVELGVGIAVAATMLLIYFCLSLNNASKSKL